MPAMERRTKVLSGALIIDASIAQLAVTLMLDKNDKRIQIKRCMLIKSREILSYIF
jgi:hypothetical protein